MFLMRVCSAIVLAVMITAFIAFESSSFQSLRCVVGLSIGAIVSYPTPPHLILSESWEKAEISQLNFRVMVIVVDGSDTNLARGVNES